jgi:hypothetical protein
MENYLKMKKFIIMIVEIGKVLINEEYPFALN